MYMSYCRFEGTRQELLTCLQDVDDHVNGEAEYPVSESEVYHFRKMIVEVVDWLHDMALLDDEGYLDEDELDDVCANMEKAGADDDD